MDRDFVERVLATVEKYARSVFGRDDDKVTLAIVLAWYCWRSAREERKVLPAGVWARVGVRHVAAGRDLPGVQASKFRDLWDNAERWGGAGMGEVRDRRPGPALQAEQKEAYAAFKDCLNDQERRMVEAIEADLNLGTADLAELLNRSPARISQMRRELMAKRDA